VWPTIEDVEPLWMDGYHDGVLSGIASAAGRLCWFQVAAETVEGQPSGSRYLLFELLPDEADALQREHVAFETHVGTHLCYHLPRESRRLGPANAGRSSTATSPHPAGDHIASLSPT
jgi:hypothetical protein